MDQVIVTIAVMLGIPAAILIPTAAFHLVVHPRRNGGLGFFEARRILGSGAIAQAQIVDSREVKSVYGGSSRIPAAIVEFALDVETTPPFRTKATTVLTSDDYSDLKELGNVPVRIRRSDNRVVVDLGAAKKARQVVLTAAKRAEAERFDAALRKR
jgi:hypothetical protein